MKIGVLTTTRAEYGLLKRLISRINEDTETELVLIVTGTHLYEEYGYTVKFIEDDGFPIKKRIFVDICSDDSESISLTMGRYFEKFAGVFEELDLDFLIVLGDRYELIPICFCAANAKTPIAHISGGEITEGAIDDAVRHSVSKLSYLHFPACEEYRKRVIQLGEAPERVINVGDPGVENVKTMLFDSEENIRNKYGLLPNLPYFVVVFHPITLDKMLPQAQAYELVSALEMIQGVQFVFLKSNADSGSAVINTIFERFVEQHACCKMFSSIAVEDFLALQKYSLGIIGNSSSGIVETPCFGVPTINIGDRQKGRLMADSIISCQVDKTEIVNAIKCAMGSEFKEKARQTTNPYGSGNTSEEILCHIKSTIQAGIINLKKSFFDIKGS